MTSDLLHPPQCLHDPAGNPTDLVLPGIVRNLLKTNFYLRIPQIREQDLASKTLTLPPSVDVEIEYREFCAVELELIELDRKNVVRIIRYPTFPPPNVATSLDIEDDLVPVANNIQILNFGAGLTAVDNGGGRVTVDSAVALSSAPPLSVGTANSAGVATTASRSDHVHQGVHSVKNGALGTQRYGDLTIESGTNVTVTEPTPGNFRFDVAVAATTEFEVTAGLGLIADYTGGRAQFNGTQYTIAGGMVAIPPSSTVDVFVDIDGIVKQAAVKPPNSRWLATVTTNAVSITGVIDRRTSVDQTLQWGVAVDLATIEPDDPAVAGVSEKYARADHQHAIAADTAVTLNANSVNTEGVAASFARSDHTHDLATGTASTITPEEANAEGSSANLARADHIHHLPTDVAVSLDATSSNTEGVAAFFARADHTHDIATGIASSLLPEQGNQEGTSANLARADHIHDAPTDIAVTLGIVNAEGTAASFSRSDHVHAHGDQPGDTLHALATSTTAGFMSAADKDKLDDLTEIDIQKDDVTIVADAETLNFEGPNVVVVDEGGFKATVTIGNAPGLHAPTHRPATGTDPLDTAAPTVTLSATTSNAVGTGDSFSRSDHVHAILTASPITQLPDQANAVGTASALARADHVHNIPAESAVTIGTANAEGTAASFSRSDHVHAHGDQPGGTLHALATTITPGFMSAADKTKLDGLTEPDVQYNDVTVVADAEIINFEGSGVTVTDEGGQKVTISIAPGAGAHASTHLPSGSDPIDTDPAVTLSAATTNTEGTANALARSDHTHDILTGNVGFLGGGGAASSNLEGTGAEIARADHVHRWQEVTSFVGLPGSPVNGQVVFANYGNYYGLFSYDSSRSKWLSLELLSHSWNSNTNNSTTNVVLTAHDDNTQQDNDYPNPHTITVVGMMGSQSNTIGVGNETRWEIATYDLGTTTLTQNVASVSATTGRYGRDLTLNVNISDLVVLSARRVKVSGSDNITRPALTMFYRIRLS